MNSAFITMSLHSFPKNKERMFQMNQILLVTASSVVLSAIISFFGDWDATMNTLAMFMAIDYATGMVVAGVFHKSTKTETGAYESRAGFKGLCRKGVMFLIVLISHRLDILLGSSYIKDMACIAFIINELISIIENVGLMGVPVPKIITKAIDILKKKEGDNDGRSSQS